MQFFGALELSLLGEVDVEINKFRVGGEGFEDLRVRYGLLSVYDLHVCEFHLYVGYIILFSLLEKLDLYLFCFWLLLLLFLLFLGF